jgi:hypothetical protein
MGVRAYSNRGHSADEIRIGNIGKNPLDSQCGWALGRIVHGGYIKRKMTALVQLLLTANMHARDCMAFFLYLTQHLTKLRPA